MSRTRMPSSGATLPDADDSVDAAEARYLHPSDLEHLKRAAQVI